MNDLSDATRDRIRAAWPRMIARLADSDLVRDVLAEAGVTRHDMARYRASTPGAQLEWDDARIASADSFMDEALNVARDPHVTIGKNPDGTDIVVRRDSSHTRTYIDTLKWAARIRNPQGYSDKTTIDMNVKTVDLTAIINAANARLLASQQGRVIEHTDNNDASMRVHAHADNVATLTPLTLASIL